MDNTVAAAVVIVALVALAAIAVWIYKGRRTERLRRQFGPEYDRMLATRRGRREIEDELEGRARRVKGLRLRELEPGDRDDFAARWWTIQRDFAEDPARAVEDADTLVRDVMRARGYPADDFEQCASDISVQHAALVEPYRQAHAVARAAHSGQASTEDLRQATVYYRTLFGELLGERARKREVRDERAA